MKTALMKNLTNEAGVIAALAIDQRPILEKMFREAGAPEVQKTDIELFKKIVSEELTPYTSAILLDPQFGIPAMTAKAADCGLLIAYEETGYGFVDNRRIPELSQEWTIAKIKEAHGDAVKFMVYYDIDSAEDVNLKKQTIIQEVGEQCQAQGIPYFLELLTYDSVAGVDVNSAEFAEVRPRKVNEMMRLFSEERFHVDVLKVETPVNIKYVEGFSEGSFVYTQAQAQQFFKEQSAVSQVPFIFLSAGVSSQLFNQTLMFAKSAGSQFSGVLCGRATWAKAVPLFVTGGEAAVREWLRTTGKENVEALNATLLKTATPL